MRIVQVTYGHGLTVLLRDPHSDGRYLRGIACNELGVADRTDCRDQEFVVREDRIVAMEEVPMFGFEDEEDTAPSFVLEAGREGRVWRAALHLLRITAWLFAVMVLSVLGVLVVLWWFVGHPTP